MSPSVSFEAVFAASPNAYMLLDRELRYVAANPAYLTATQSRLEDLLGRHITDVFPHDPNNPHNANAALLRASLERALRTGKTDVLAFIPYRIAVMHGNQETYEERHWSATHTPIANEAGQVEFVLQHTVDVTDVHNARAASAQMSPGQKEAGILGRAELVQQQNLALDSKLRQLQEIFEQAPGFMCFLLGPEHVFELANASYHALVGHREILGKPLREALPELAEQVYLELLEQVLATGESFVGRAMPVRVQRAPSGPSDELIIDFVYQPVLNDAGKPVGVLVHGHDITRQKQAEARIEKAFREAEAARAEAEEANQLKDEFLATVSHELRTPLSAILGWIHMLKKGMLAEEKRARALEVIERNATVQAQLIEDLLDVSRIIAGKLSLELGHTDLVAVVVAALETVRPTAQAKGVRLELDVQTAACAVLADGRRLQQVVWNLLSNAVKFTPRGGLVEVTVSSVAGTVSLSVKDTGLGIAADFLPNVFERFRQAESSATRQMGGLGLGLSIVHHLVEAHGGEVRAFSEGLGKGATFSVQLPCLHSRDALATVQQDSGGRGEPSPALDGMHVLVVEDDADTREYLRTILEKAHVRVSEASSGSEALLALKRERPDILLSDIAMLGGDGYSLVRNLRALPPSEGGDTPAVALTAYARAEDRTRALLAGFHNHVSKPVQTQELLAVLGSFGHRRRIPS